MPGQEVEQADRELRPLAPETPSETESPKPRIPEFERDAKPPQAPKKQERFEIAPADREAGEEARTISASMGEEERLIARQVIDDPKSPAWKVEQALELLKKKNE